MAYRSYSKEYVDVETFARDAGVGIWRGEFVAPWEWRRGKRLSGNTEAPNCLIKGNVNSKGQRIYHVSDGQFYGQVKINPLQGDKCFQTEEEAKSAGFRRSMR